MPSDIAELDDTSKSDRLDQIRRLVISIDYGTTYTGISFATPLGEEATLDEVDVVTDWGANMTNQDKVQSVISYSDRTVDMENNWGDSLAPEAVAMKHMKLKLDIQSVSEELNFLLQSLDGTDDLNFEHIRKAKNLPEYTDKSPEEVVKDYLTKVFEHLLIVVDNFTNELRERIETDIVITIPVNWSYVAKNSTYQAVTRAGFNSETFPRLKDVMFVTEPEAAAIYVARHFDEMRQQFLKVAECFILCDAGGGTVDIVSYQVEQLTPTLKLKRVGFPTGRKCGSIFIDWAFKLWLRRLLGDKLYLQIDPNADLNRVYGAEGRAMRALMKRFDVIKKAFSQDTGPMYLDLPRPLNNLTLDNRVDGGQITIPNETMREFFDPCVDEIVQMIKFHIHTIDDLGFRVKNLFLVGGFGESKFLQEEISDTLRLREDRTLRIPATSWSAVARGGAICGIEKSTMSSIITTSQVDKHYGIAVDESFSHRSDPRDLAINPESGKKIAKNQMRWLLSKGDVICSDEPTIASHDFTIYFKKDDFEKRKGTVIIYSYAEEKNRPSRLHNAKTELVREQELDFDLRGIPLTEFERRSTYDPSKDYYATSITLKVLVTKDGQSSELLWKGKPLDPTVSEYESYRSRDRSSGTASYVRLGHHRSDISL